MHVYLSKNDGSGNLGYRGETTGADNPESFKQLMEDRGLQVHLADEYQGRLIDQDLNTLEN